jgi:hypothetical protein
MASDVERHLSVYGAFPNNESVTVLTVTGGDRESVAAGLDVDLSDSAEPFSWDDGRHTSWSIHEVAGGVVAFELSGFGDPSLAALRALSSNGGAAAVVRSNVLHRLRFGCARNGRVLFDDGDFAYRPTADGVPDEVRELFDSVLVGRDIDGYAENGRDGFAAALAMAEIITGVGVPEEHARGINGFSYYRAPSLTYAREADAISTRGR